jgi:signal transduction histidine kinase
VSLFTEFVVAFSAPARRAEASNRLASRLGAECVVLFTKDVETESLVPTPPFEDSAAAPEWRRAAQEASDRPLVGPVMLPHPLTGNPAPVLLRGAEDGSVLAAVGGQPHPRRLAWAARILPVLAAAVKGDRIKAMAARLRKAERDALNADERCRHAEARAQEAIRLKDDFLATLSHELRTPLNAMLGWIQMLQLYRNDEGVWNRAIEVIQRNARAQTQIVADLLDVSRIITGKLHLRVSRVDLPDIVRAGCDSLRPSIETKNLQLTIHTPPVFGVVVGDPDRLQQVVWNLVSNAAKFTAPGGRIDVSVGADETCAWIAVSDTGVGIPPEFVPHVFERFRQRDSTITRAYGGIGLGLAIVRHLVELHGGTVKAASEGEGRGATFTVRLPYRRLETTEQVVTDVA